MSTLPTTQGKTIPDATDYKGHPAERSKTGGWTASAMILGLTNLSFYNYMHLKTQGLNGLPCSHVLYLYVYIRR